MAQPIGNAPDSTDLLYKAIEENDNNGLLSALEQGADIEATGSGGPTPLITAVMLDHYDCVKTLIEHGADVNAVNPTLGTSALMLAVTSSEPRIPLLLIENGADVNAQDKKQLSVLQWAFAKPATHEVFRALVANGADPTTRDKWGISMLDMARDRHLDEIAQILQLGTARNPLQS